MNWWVELGILVLVFVITFPLNKKFAEICQHFQRSVFGLEYELRLFRIPIYALGGLFVLILAARLLL